ncbi:unnamed protein product [Nezara viridula]|uniref:RNase H type-1 domain-containing protein n=1 Tax=Nezara viridula TaxID=85310 RepID=A0A9P0ML72_NEZVI|nr:unnamed protein product [Nezara viridula]
MLCHLSTPLDKILTLDTICLEVTNCENVGITTYSDSHSPLQALESHKVTSRLVQECKQALKTLAFSKRVELVWVPSHKGIKGNEKAIAREGVEFFIVGPEPAKGIYKKHQRKEVLDWTWKKAGKEWREYTRLRQVQTIRQNLLSLQN